VPKELHDLKHNAIGRNHSQHRVDSGEDREMKAAHGKMSRSETTTHGNASINTELINVRGSETNPMWLHKICDSTDNASWHNEGKATRHSVSILLSISKSDECE
jgi:hypothetical protein